MNVDKLIKLNACDPGVEWARTQKSQKAAWNNCERGDWMLWLLGKLAGKPDTKSRKKLCLCCAEVAKLALPYAGENEKACRDTINTVIRYYDDKATLDEVRAAAYAAAAAADAAADDVVVAYADADVAAYAAAADAAAYAAAADAAAVADAAAAVVVVVVVAAYAAADAADAAADAAAAVAARKNTLKEAANIVRKYYPHTPRLK